MKTMGYAEACKIFKNDPVFQEANRKALLMDYEEKLIVPPKRDGFIKKYAPWFLWHVIVKITPRFYHKTVKGIKWYFDNVILLGYEFQHGDDYGQNMNKFRVTITLMDFNIDFILEDPVKHYQWGIRK